MYIRDLHKDLRFVKMNQKEFIVDEYTTPDGVRVLATSKDPFKAKCYTAQQAYTEVYNALSEEEKENIMTAFKNDHAYDILSPYVAKHYKILTAETLDYGYSSDCADERRLLTELDMQFVFDPDVAVQKSNEEDILYALNHTI